MSLSKKVSFEKAVPVWEKGTQNEMNRSLVFRANVGAGKKTLRIAGHTKYQIFVNGEFLAEGPARAAHGYFRVSEYEISEKLDKELNPVCIITAGYNSNSYYLTDRPSFLCAEITGENGVEFATGTENGFECAPFDARVRKVQRYSFQRPFTESYIFGKAWDAFFTDPDFIAPAAELEKTEDKVFIERRVPYCRYREINAQSTVNTGECRKAIIGKKFSDRSFDGINELLKGYKKKDLERAIVNEVYALKSVIKDGEKCPFAPVSLPENGFVTCDMGVNTTGFIKLKILAREKVTVYAVFNEKLPAEGVPDAGRDNCANVVLWELEGGREYTLISFEPYTYKFIQIIAKGGAADVNAVSQLRETYDETLTVNKKTMPTPELRKIYDAAYESFVQNATDIFMDCPSRERAGWLCDSFFTSRVEKALTGSSIVENNFLENFILPGSFPRLTDGMLPMCYPADHYDGCYIPNWSMWYVLELREYLRRSGDRELVNAAKERLYKLAEFFEKYENADGLLQKLDSWVFVEWSAANEYTQDINYPSNMLYTVFLDCFNELYGDEGMAAKAEKLRETIREKSFDGEFFVDNAILGKDGKAQNTRNRTETCQYYAFFSKTATKEKYPALWDTMINEFGPVRDKDDRHPDIPRANAFIGNYLRLDLLFADGLYDKLISEITDFFLPMANETGTLWENMTDRASCNHGFASHVICWLNAVYG